jgi:hypothetical protein
VTIKPHGESLGHALHVRSRSVREHMEFLTLKGRLLIEKEAMVLFAGRIAQSKYRGVRVRWGHEADYHEIAGLCLRVCGSGAEMQRTWTKLILLRAEEMVDYHWPQIQAVAARLVEKKTLNRTEFQEALQSLKNILWHGVARSTQRRVENACNR